MQVRWDDVDTNRHGRVSPWEIEPTGSVSCSANFVTPGFKRTKVGMSSANSEFSAPGIFCIDTAILQQLLFLPCFFTNIFGWQMELEHQTLGNP